MRKTMSASNKEKLQKGCLWTIGIFILIVLLGNLVGNNKENKEKEKEQSLEYNLATIEAGYSVSQDDIRIARFRSLLRELSSKYVESSEQIANITANAKNNLREEGIDESMLKMMEGFNSIFITPISNQEYVSYISIYIVSRTKGSMTHEEAISGLRQIVQRLGMQ